MFLLLSFFSCKKKQQELPTQTYVLTSRSVQVYTNEYDDKERLVKQSIHWQTINPYGPDDWEKHFFYDDQDSLKEIRTYTLTPNTPDRKIYSIEQRTGSTWGRAIYRQYPNDTSLYHTYRMDANQNIVEEYQKDDPYESRTIHTYIDNQLVSTVKEDIANEVTTTRSYINETRNDTLVSFAYENNELVWEGKKYQDNGISIEVGRSINDPMGSVDSIFHGKENYKNISYHADEKRVFKIRYDEYGNEAEFVIETWEIPSWE